MEDSKPAHQKQQLSPLPPVAAPERSHSSGAALHSPRRPVWCKRPGKLRRSPMTQRLHLVFGGELTDTQGTEFRNVQDIDIVGMFPDYASAYAAWKARAQATVDQAQTRYFIAHLHRLVDEEEASGPTAEVG
jgi:hypothetical protein